MARILTEEYRAGAYTCVMHCFSSGAGLAAPRSISASTCRCRASPPSRKPRSARDLRRAPGRPHPRGDRQPLSRPPALSRQAQRTGLYRAHRARRRRGLRPDGGRVRRRHQANFDRLFTRPPLGEGGLSMAELRFTILGCGSSGGVPRLGGHWGDCDPDNPRNTRRRCSCWCSASTRAGAHNRLIDTSPDLRQQLLDAGIGRLDAVIYTHSHADHVHGLDDLRQDDRLQHAPAPAGLGRRTDAERPSAPLRLRLRAARGQRLSRRSSTCMPSTAT
jgi:hypothetical protein